MRVAVIVMMCLAILAGCTSTPMAISKEQVDQLGVKSTVDDLKKLVGELPNPVREADGKRTYEFPLSGQKGMYTDITFDKDGKLLEKNVFSK